VPDALTPDETVGAVPKRHRGRWWLVASAAAGAVAVAGTATALAQPDRATGVPAVTTGTTTVVRTDLKSSQQVTGSLGYLDAYTLSLPGGLAAAAGTQSATSSQSQAGTAAAQLAGAQKALADARAVSSAQTAQASTVVDNDRAALDTDRAQLAAAQSALAKAQVDQAAACAGTGATSQACQTATQHVTTLTTQVDADRATVDRDQATLAADTSKLDVVKAQGQQSVNQAQTQVDTYTAQLRGAQSSQASTTAVTLAGQTVTRLAAVGDVVDRGQPAYWLDGHPVPLLIGTQAAYRPFQPGMADGTDVRQLQDNLTALGLGAGVAPNGHFDAATQAAVRRLQNRLGVPATGSLGLGAVAFLPAPLRVTGQVATAGGPAQPGQPLLTGTSTTRAVIVALPAAQQTLVHTGDQVAVNLPDGRTTTTGHVTQVSTVASSSTQPGQGGGGPGSGGTGGQGSASAQQQAAGTTVPVTIGLDDLTAAGALDQVPVTVDITDQVAPGVLAVPVQALLALSGGGYGVRLAGASGTSVVPVTTGLFGDGLVQVSGPGIREGTIVQVPAS
jgi:hypothetical protein